MRIVIFYDDKRLILSSFELRNNFYIAYTLDTSIYKVFQDNTFLYTLYFIKDEIKRSIFQWINIFKDVKHVIYFMNDDIINKINLKIINTSHWFSEAKIWTVENKFEEFDSVFNTTNLSEIRRTRSLGSIRKTTSPRRLFSSE